jgi:hypothetical protein
MGSMPIRVGRAKALVGRRYLCKALTLVEITCLPARLPEGRQVSTHEL